MMKPIERPCLPAALQLEAEQAERRKDEALDRLLQTVAGEGPMKTSSQGLTLLMEREGVRNTAYLDSVGVATIGVGHCGPEVHLGLVWTDEKCREVFAKDIERFEKALNENLKVTVEQFEFDALVSWLFNVGADWARRATLIKKVNAEDPNAWREFDKWHIPAEITSRRNAEREQFRGAQFAARLS